MPGGSLVHMYRGEDPKDITKSLCGQLENPRSQVSGTIGTYKTVNCAMCVDIGRQTEVITAPINAKN